MARTRIHVKKPNNFDIEVKGQGHTEVINIPNTSPHHSDTLMCQVWYAYLKEQRSYGPDTNLHRQTDRQTEYMTHRLMVMHPCAKYRMSMAKNKEVMARTRIHVKKLIILTLRWKVKVIQRSFIYATHRLIVIHPNMVCLPHYSPDTNLHRQTDRQTVWQSDSYIPPKLVFGVIITLNERWMRAVCDWWTHGERTQNARKYCRVERFRDCINWSPELVDIINNQCCRIIVFTNKHWTP